MKRFLFLFTLIPFFAHSQYTTIPDSNFENYLILYGVDTILDGKVLTSNISSIQYIDVSNGGISNLTGIEDFTSLIQLGCYENQLTILDVSSCTNLIHLECYENQLASLDVSSCTNLQFLDCETNFLTNLDLSQNTALITLWCYENQLTNINVTGCFNLEDFEFDNNQLSSIDISSNINLIHIDAFDNNLTSFDVSNNTALTDLSCWNNKLTSLDVSNNPNIESIEIQSNDLECLNLKNGNNSALIELSAQNNPNLTCIQVDDSVYSTTNWLRNPGIPIPGFSTNFNYDTTQFFSQNCNYSSSCSSSSNIWEELSFIYIYPNPTNNFVKIGIDNYNGSFEVEIYDLQGRLLETTKSKTVSLKKYSKGIYIFRVSYADRTQEVRVLRQ